MVRKNKRKGKDRSDPSLVFLRPLLSEGRLYHRSTVAAGAENENDSEDDYPGAVIVEKMAKAIVVHICYSSMVSFRASLPYVSIICRSKKAVTVIIPPPYEYS